MCIKSRRPYIIQVICGLVLVCIMLGLMVASPGRADVGVQPILPGGSSLKPEDETPVEMQAEKVTLNVRKATEADNAVVKLNPEIYGLQYTQYSPSWYPAVAEVNADFILKNPTSRVVSMTVWFPLASVLESVEWELNPEEIVPRIEGFQVTVDGKAVDFGVSELPNPKGADKPPLPWASFPVTFPAGEEVLIQVSYVLPAQPTLDYAGMTLYYIFQTGAGWAGPIGKAELVVNLPYPASAETIGAMPEGGQAEGQQVRWTWENLEPGPQDDFSILLLLPERWDELQAARADVKARPSDGQAWLNLGSTYKSLIFRGQWNYQISEFGETYQPLAVQACQEAARLLPGYAEPHVELAMVYLSMLPRNPSPEALQPVLDELKLGEGLELFEALKPNFDDMLEWFLYNDATATAQSATWTVENAASEVENATANAGYEKTGTAEAEATLMVMSTKELIQTPTLASTPVPSTTPQPPPTAVPPTPTKSQPGMMTGNGQSLIIIVAAGVIGLVIVGYLVLKRK